MDAEQLRALAQRCRELSRTAVVSEVKTQLLEWSDDFETEAEAAAAKAEAEKAEC